MSRPARQGARAAGVVTAALLLLVAADRLAPVPDVPLARARPVAVVGATAVCPDVRQAPGDLRTRVSVAVPVPATGTATGTATVRPLSAPGAGAPLALSGSVPVVAGLGGDVDGGALVVQARGALAAGLEVEQLTRAGSGPARGLAAARCDVPRTDAWWVGGSTLPGESAVLVLANPDDTPAEVDVSVLTSAGPADAAPGRGVPVAPHGRAAVRLERLAPDRDLLAVHVRALRGRVAGGVRALRGTPAVPRGVDWVPLAGPPARDVVVPGLPPGPGRRTVLVANPGQDAVVVRLELSTGDGQLEPAALAQVRVPAGSTVGPDVTALLAHTPGTVRVDSPDGPVLAAAMAVDGRAGAGGRPDGPVRELAFAGAGAPLRGPAVVVAAPAPVTTTLLLGAPATDVRVEVVRLGVPGRTGAAGRVVAVPAGRTLVVPLPGGATAVEVRPQPGSGPVYASRELREDAPGGPLTSLLTLVGAPGLVPRPAVAADPLAGVG